MSEDTKTEGRLAVSCLASLLASSSALPSDIMKQAALLQHQYMSHTSAKKLASRNIVTYSINRLRNMMPQLSTEAIASLAENKSAVISLAWSVWLPEGSFLFPLPSDLQSSDYRSRYGEYVIAVNNWAFQVLNVSASWTGATL